jgi:hypothetical protein
VADGSLEHAEFSSLYLATVYTTFSRLPTRGSLEMVAAFARTSPHYRTLA